MREQVKKRSEKQEQGKLLKKEGGLGLRGLIRMVRKYFLKGRVRKDSATTSALLLH